MTYRAEMLALGLLLGCQSPTSMPKPNSWERELASYNADHYSMEQQTERKAESLEPQFRQQSRMTGEFHRRDKLIAASFLMGKSPTEMQDLYQQQSRLFMEMVELTAKNQQGMLELLGESVDFRHLVEARLEEVTSQYEATWEPSP